MKVVLKARFGHLNRKNKMINYDIFPVDNSGLIPHTDTRTQTIEQITQDGVLCWKVTNYSIQELQGVGTNTDTEWYVNYYTILVNNITKKVSEIKADSEYYDALTSDQKIEIDIYQTQISAIPSAQEFPVGVIFPQVPSVVSTYMPIQKIPPFK
jgi:hypothetical protein